MIHQKLCILKHASQHRFCGPLQRQWEYLVNLLTPLTGRLNTHTLASDCVSLLSLLEPFE